MTLARAGTNDASRITAMNIKICILIPVYNESKAIGSIVKALKLKKLDVFVIDDGSTDNSGLYASDNGAIVMRNEQKKGKGFSLKRGFRFILQHQYDGIITMDGDGQHDVLDVDSFILKAQADPASVVAGSRMEDHKGMPFVRLLTNRFMSFLISVACRQRISDTQCGYRYIGCEVLRNVKLTSNDFEIETEMLMKAAKKGFKIYSVPVKTIYNDAESYIHPVKDTFRFIIYFIRELFSKP